MGGKGPRRVLLLDLAICGQHVAFHKIPLFWRLIVTPDIHRVHHSVLIWETDSNFGFNLSWWDRVFGTYIDQPAAGHEAMKIGLANYRNPKWLKLGWMLVVPASRYER